MLISEKIAYLNGLFDGLSIDSSKKEGKVLKGILDVLSEMAISIEDIEVDIEEINESLEDTFDDIDEIYSELDDTNEFYDVDLDVEEDAEDEAFRDLFFDL